MSLGIVVDGDAEAIALGEITSRIANCPQAILRPIYAPLQPKASPGQIARAAAPRIDLLRNRGASRLVVLIDREDRSDCPSTWAREIEQAIAGLGIANASVVVKNRTFENWLAADPDAFRGMPKRWQVTAAFANAVSGNKADNVLNAEMLLNTIVNTMGRYHKRVDAIRIAQRVRPHVLGANSRSFRRLLRVLQHPSYLNQSRHPA